MSIGTFLKTFRDRRSITQKQLSEMLEVNVMTVSRLESKDQVVLTPKMVEKIAGILNDEDLASLNPTDPQENKILNYKKFETQSSVSRTAQSKKVWSADIKGQIDTLMEKVGYTFLDSGGSTLVYQNQTNEKFWVVMCLSWDPTLPSDKSDNIKRQLIFRVGKTLLYDDGFVENKITIAVPNSFDEIKHQLPYCIPEYLPFDISILHFGDDGTIQQETYLRCNTDGCGIFDLDVEDTAISAQAGKDYAAWTRAVGNIVMWEKSK